MKLIVFVCFSLLLALTFWQAPSHAQEHTPAPRAEGELKGLVVDWDDARIVGAKITAENKKYSFEAWSNEEGAFKLKLPVSEYLIKIESYGFGTYVRKRVRIEADETKAINVTLQVAPIIDTIRIK